MICHKKTIGPYKLVSDKSKLTETSNLYNICKMELVTIKYNFTKLLVTYVAQENQFGLVNCTALNTSNLYNKIMSNYSLLYRMNIKVTQKMISAHKIN